MQNHPQKERKEAFAATKAMVIKMNMLLAEWRRLRYNPIIWAVVAADVLYGIVLAVQYRGFPGGTELFRGMLADPVLPAWVSALLPVLLVGSDFASREVDWFLFSGHRREEYFGMKAVELLLFTWLLCGLPLLIVLVGRTGDTGAGEILWCLFLRLLLDSSLASIGLLIAFLLRDLTRCAAVSLTNAILALIFSKPFYEETLGVMNRLMQVHPVLSYPKLLNGTLPVGDILKALILIGLSWAISYSAFRGAELK